MKKLLVFFLTGTILMKTEILHAQFKKIDTTVTTGNVGYRVRCSNSYPDKNDVTLKLIGFEKEAKGTSFLVGGQIAYAMIDDLNNDNYPELLLVSFNGPHFQYGITYVLASKENKSLLFFSSKDIMMDGKLSPGYRGHDQFSLFNGSLIQKFPIYNTGDTDENPTGGSRVVQYQMAMTESGKAYFKVLRTYDQK